MVVDRRGQIGAIRWFEEHYPVKFLGKDVKSNWVRCVLCDNDGSVWFGTDNGLFHFFPETGKYFVYRNDPQNSSSITDNDIKCLYKDKQNILWVGTSNGLNAVYPLQSQFHVYKNIRGDRNSLLSNITSGSFKDYNSVLWVGTLARLEAIDPVQNKFSHYAYLDRRLKYATDYDILLFFKMIHLQHG